MIMIWLLVVLLILLALRVPVFISLLALSLIYIAVNPTSLNVVVQSLTSGLESFPLLAVPMFVLAGSIMAGGGLAERLMQFASTLVGHHPGGLAQVNVLNSFLVGGMSGSGTADAAMDAKILVPIMRRNGYSLEYSSAITAASSTIAPILPPSIGLIIYGVLANVSIGDLFIGGVLPGILIALMLSITVRILAVVLKHPRARERRAGFSEVMRGLWSAFGALLMPVLLIVGLRIGVFTPTELAAVAVIYALLLSIFGYKQITWRDVPRILNDSALICGMLLVVLAAASVFSKIVAYERIPDQLANLLGFVVDNPLGLLLVINLMLLILGTLVDATSLLIILTPVLAPIAIGAGVDPVHFGLVMVFNVVIGSVSPPVGGTLFTVMAITGVKLGPLVRAFMPLYVALLLVLVLLTVFPWIVTWLPGALPQV